MLTILFGFSLVLALASRPLGLLAQRFLTVSTRFARAGLARVVLRPRRSKLLRFEVFVDVDLGTVDVAPEVQAQQQS